jgi:hypothetical protein
MATVTACQRWLLLAFLLPRFIERLYRSAVPSGLKLIAALVLVARWAYLGALMLLPEP